MQLQEAIDACLKIDSKKIENLISLVSHKDEIIILGNGGSSAIASHISQDYTKKLKKKSFTFCPLLPKRKLISLFEPYATIIEIVFIVDVTFPTAKIVVTLLAKGTVVVVFIMLDIAELKKTPCL